MQRLPYMPDFQRTANYKPGGDGQIDSVTPLLL